MGASDVLQAAQQQRGWRTNAGQRDVHNGEAEAEEAEAAGRKRETTSDAGLCADVTPISLIGDRRPSKMGSGNVLLNLILFDTAVHIT